MGSGDPTETTPRDPRSCLSELRGFALSHRSCGVIRGHRGPETPSGYRLEVTCPCGATFERWLAPGDRDAELLREALLGFEV